QRLDLFHLSEHSPGSPFWHPHGMVIWNELEDLRRRENRVRGYSEVKTPLLYDVETYITSGHYENYREHMFFVTSKEDAERQFALSTRPEKKVGTDEEWDFTEGALRSALDRRGIEYVLMPGEGAFYGPKIDLHMTDVLGRSWQMGTIQLDAIMPQRFGLSYMG